MFVRVTERHRCGSSLAAGATTERAFGPAFRGAFDMTHQQFCASSYAVWHRR